MKTFELLAGIQSSELKACDSVIKSQGRASLHKLFVHLCGRVAAGKAPEKQAMYQAAFGASYETAKDYLLRNELRLLNDRLLQFLARREFEIECETNDNFYHQWILKALGRRGIQRQLKLAFGNYHDKAESDGQYDICCDMLGRRLQSLIQSSPTKDDKGAEPLDLIRRQRSMLQRQFVRSLRELELRQVHILRQYAGQAPEAMPQPAESIDLMDADLNDDYAWATYYSVLAFGKTGMELVAVLEHSFTYLERCDIPGKNNKSQLLIILSKIAVESLAVGEITTAASAYRRMNDLAERHELTLFEPLFYNYFSFLITTAKYREAVDLYPRRPKQDGPNLRRDQNYRCKLGMCYIMLGNTEEALECINSARRQTEAGAQYYFRFIRICAFALDGDFESALRESDNLIDSISYKSNHDERDEFSLRLARMYRSCFEAMLQPEPQRSQRKSRVAQRLHSFLDEQSLDLRMDIPAQWLKKECAGLA